MEGSEEIRGEGRGERREYYSTTQLFYWKLTTDNRQLITDNSKLWQKKLKTSIWLLSMAAT